MKRCFAMLIWAFAFVGALFWFAVWSMFFLNYVHGQVATTVSGLTGLIPLLVATWA